MSKLNFEYVPLTFISNKEEIKKQIKNTLILIHLFEKYNDPTPLKNLIEGTQYGYNASALQSGQNKFLRISDIHESKVDWETVPYCNCDDEETYLLKNEDILIARTGGTTGKSFKIDTSPLHSIYAGYLIRIRAKQTVNPDYLYLFLHSFAYWSQIVNLNEGNFRPKANAENLKALILPNCSKNIQDDAVRISQGENLPGYEELFDKIETVLLEYEKTQKIEELFADQLTQLENLNQAILQEAVQGKLVAQDSNDEPASVLLKRIKTEKSKSGKKEKPLPPIKPEEIPFEIPESWTWCRLGEITNIVRGGSPRPAGDKTYYDGNIPFLKVGDLTEGHDIYLYKHTYTIKEAGLYKTRFVEANTLMLTNSGATLGYPKICTFPTTFNDGIAAFLDLPDDFDKVYLFYFLKSLTGWFLKVASRGQGQPNLNTDIIGFTLLPIPPREEQKRIVAEIERQLEKTKQLKEHIIANQQATEQLLKALLHGAFEVEEEKEEAKVVPVVEFKPTNVDYYKRSLLAAELVWQLHKEPTLGHLKLQKLIYLCQKTTEMQLPTNFLRQAMGPYDPKLMRSIDKQLKEHKWFEFKQGELLKYKPLEKAGQHKADFEKFFSEEQSGIQYIINKFKSTLSNKIEIVATLYACIENMMSEKLIFSEGLLLERFYNWSEEKSKFKEDDVRQAFARMIETGIIPKGFNM